VFIIWLQERSATISARIHETRMNCSGYPTLPIGDPPLYITVPPPSRIT
jgi:hypothetical protein